jgi:hypothetical protein
MQCITQRIHGKLVEYAAHPLPLVLRLLLRDCVYTSVGSAAYLAHQGGGSSSSLQQKALVSRDYSSRNATA